LLTCTTTSRRNSLDSTSQNSLANGRLRKASHNMARFHFAEELRVISFQLIPQIKWAATRRPTPGAGTVPRKSLCSPRYSRKWYRAGVPDGLRWRSGNNI
jgi:hypothetical protein